jgi:hypothetical protein
MYILSFDHSHQSCSGAAQSLISYSFICAFLSKSSQVNSSSSVLCASQSSRADVSLLRVLCDTAARAFISSAFSSWKIGLHNSHVLSLYCPRDVPSHCFRKVSNSLDHLVFRRGNTKTFHCIKLPSHRIEHDIHIRVLNMRLATFSAHKPSQSQLRFLLKTSLYPVCSPRNTRPRLSSWGLSFDHVSTFQSCNLVQQAVQ